MTVEPLPPERLFSRCDPEGLAFKTTDDLPDLEGVVGQARALEAIEFGARIERPGFNLFLLGPPGTGKLSTVRRLLERKAAAEAPPFDWVYAHSFEVAHRPKALKLPAGRGAALVAAVRRLIEDIRAAVPAAFEADDYRNRRQALEAEFRERQEKTFEEFRQRAQHKSIAVLRTPLGLALAPVRGGEVIKPDVYGKLPRAEREQIEADIEALQKELEGIVAQTPRRARELREAVRRLDREVTEATVGHPIDELVADFADLPDIVAHVQAMRADLIENIHLLLRQDENGNDEDEEPPPVGHRIGLGRYEINLLVDNGGAKGAPVVYEDHPTIANLVGRVEYAQRMGALVTDFSLIKAGALHRANGGYLILDAREILSQILSWEALKRMLRAERITIESAGQMLSLISTVSLEPEPIPLDVKVVLLGDRLLYYLLGAYDPEFPELFKVAADFDDDLGRDAGTTDSYARLVATVVRRHGLLPLDRGGIARVIEHSARLAEDAEKLSLRIGTILDLLREADYAARREGTATIRAGHVDGAIAAQRRRADRLRLRAREAVRRGIHLIDTDGKRVGQVNGLNVVELGDVAFGGPSRITARVRIGEGRVIDIEREVELGGPLHSKGVLIFSGFLSSRFATDVPLSLSATLVFEQSYGGVEGDSASCAELFALLSALGEVPIDQGFAITGSVNQHGQVQPIGGVNEKIEGFFEVCAERGLTGRQGVLIPAANAQHLMLRREVVEAAAAGRFRIYPFATVDEGIALLTGLPAGERNGEGRFPAGSVNERVEARLRAFALARRAFGRLERHDERHDERHEGSV